jgi:hypothetical protein
MSWALSLMARAIPGRPGSFERLAVGFLEQAGAVGKGHRFGSAAHAQLAVHVRAVVHDRLRAQVQSGGDLRVRLAAGDRGQHLKLTAGQLGI